MMKRKLQAYSNGIETQFRWKTVSAKEQKIETQHNTRKKCTLEELKLYFAVRR